MKKAIVLVLAICLLTSTLSLATKPTFARNPIFGVQVGETYTY